MSYFRSYFEKNNTIIKDSVVNTAKNPTTEIFYGGSFSKFLFKIDFTDLINKVDNAEYLITSGTTHTLNLTNTIFGDETFLGAKRGTGRKRTNSFDLILFRINEFWDEGLGFDYDDTEYDYTSGNSTYDERPSNWFNRTTLNEWTSEGVYPDNPDLIATIHFDNGNEDIKLDITNYVNGVLTGDTHHGLGIAFAVVYQNVGADPERSVSFFTKYTQTFFEPFVESYFEDRIEDNRFNFIEKKEQNLYLYVTKGSNFYDLDENPIVDILDNTNTVIAGLTGLTTTKIRKGVYKVTFGIDGVLCDGKRFFYDKWKNLEIDGISISDITQKFIPKPYSSLYGIGENQIENRKYSIQFGGVKQNEKIIRGEKRKISITFKSIEDSKLNLFDNVYYRMYIKEGKTNVVVHDWTLTDITNENSFVLDTSFYIPREYFIEIKAKINGDEIFYPEEIKFEILSERASLPNSATII
jgi:hypothetical protein